jgi:hypothetical protein
VSGRGGGRRWRRAGAGTYRVNKVVSQRKL